MGGSGDGVVKRRLLTGTRLTFVLTVLAALDLGYFGLEEYVLSLPAGSYGTGFWNIAYYDLQLFVLGSEPLEQSGPYPRLLNIARFAAPAATLYALFEAGRALLAGQFKRWWRRRVRRGHVIVTGDTAAALALVARLREPTNRMRVTTVLVGDEESLRAEGVAGASTVYACADETDDSTVNVLTALAAVNAKRHRLLTGKLRVHAQVSDPTLALSLRARRLGLPKPDSLDVDFFNVDELAARNAIDEAAVSISQDRAAHIFVAGLGTFGRAVVVEYAQNWRLNSPRRHERVSVTLADPRATEVAAELTARWDVVRDVLSLHAIDGDLDHALRVTSAGPAPHRAYICYDDDEDMALQKALSAAQLWRGGPDSIVVRLNRLARYGDAFHTPARELFDDIDGRLHLVGVAKLGCDPSVIGQDLVERLAQAAHEQYLLEQIADAVTMGQTPAMTPWAALEKDLKDANRAQARDIGVKVGKIGCVVAPRMDGTDRFAFATDEIEMLAQHEHIRWCEERRRAGWTYGPKRDKKRKRTPALLDWDYPLPDNERDKDRDAIRNLPKVLAHVGLRIVRLAP